MESVAGAWTQPQGGVVFPLIVVVGGVSVSQAVYTGCVCVHAHVLVCMSVSVLMCVCVQACVCAGVCVWMCKCAICVQF